VLQYRPNIMQARRKAMKFRFTLGDSTKFCDWLPLKISYLQEARILNEDEIIMHIHNTINLLLAQFAEFNLGG